NDYLPVAAGDGGTSSMAGDGAASSTARDGGETADQARLDDFSVLFPEGTIPMRITRLRSDLAHAALASDLVLQAATDQTVISNVYQVPQSVNAPVCPVPPPCDCGPVGSSGPGPSSSSSSSGGSRGPGGSGLFGGSSGAGGSGAGDGGMSASPEG